MIDWSTMLAGLEQQRTGLAQELADVDAVIATVRKRAAPSVSIERPRANGTKGKRAAKAAPRSGKGGRIDDATLAPIRKQYESGVDVHAIAKSSGRSVELLYYYAKSRKWKRPKPAPTTKPAASAPTERMSEKLAGRVRCTSCDLWTEYDPCENCGKKLKRNW